MTNKEKIDLRERAYRLAHELKGVSGTSSANLLAEEIYRFLSKDLYPDPLRLDDPSPEYNEKVKKWADEIEKHLCREKQAEIDWSRPQLVATISGLVVKTTGSHSEYNFDGNVVNAGTSSHKVGDFSELWLKHVFKYHGEIPEEIHGTEHSKNDAKFLEWIYNRMRHVHDENPNLDYMIRLMSIVDSLKSSPPTGK